MRSSESPLPSVPIAMYRDSHSAGMSGGAPAFLTIQERYSTARKERDQAIQQLQRIASDYRLVQAEKQDLEAKVQDMQTRLESVLSQIAELREESRQQGLQSEHKERKVSELEEELTASRYLLQEKESLMQSMRAQIDRVTEERDTLDDLVRKRQDEIVRLRSRLGDLVQREEELKQDHSQLSSLYERDQSQFGEAREKCRRFRDQNIRLHDELSSAREKIESLEKEITDLRKTTRYAKMDSKMKSSSDRSLRRRISELEGRLRDRDRELHHVLKSSSSLMQDVGNREHRLSELFDENRVLRETVEGFKRTQEFIPGNSSSPRSPSSRPVRDEISSFTDTPSVTKLKSKPKSSVVTSKHDPFSDPRTDVEEVRLCVLHSTPHRRRSSSLPSRISPSMHRRNEDDRLNVNQNKDYDDDDEGYGNDRASSSSSFVSRRSQFSSINSDDSQTRRTHFEAQAVIRAWPDAHRSPESRREAWEPSPWIGATSSISPLPLFAAPSPQKTPNNDEWSLQLSALRKRQQNLLSLLYQPLDWSIPPTSATPSTSHPAHHHR